MRVLLVQAISTHDCGELVFPLGLARLAATIGQSHEVRGMDLNLSPFPWPDFVRELEAFKPHVVGISFRNLDPLAGNLLSFVPHLKTLAVLVTEYAPEATMVLGGSAFTLFTDRLLREVPEIRLAIAGEAEMTFPLLLENLQTPEAIPGVFWRTDEGAVAANRRELQCQDLDCLPLPDWRLFDPASYLDLNRYVAFMGVETKRGCPNNCRYCLYPVLQGHRLRLRNPGRVVGELELLQREYGISTFHFTDAVVNQPAEHLHAICKEILSRDLKIGWTGFFREDTLSAGEMDLYRESGLLTLYFSADGASDHALKLLGKKLAQSQVIHAARLAAQSGILTVYHFLVNIPGETEESIGEMRKLLESLFSIHSSTGNLGAVVLNNLRLYPGTPLTAEVLRNRLIDPGYDLLYPTYYNPPPRDGLRHELTAFCMSQGASIYLERNRLPGK